MSESRKSLLEEMKEHIEKKTSDCEDLQKQTVQLKTAIQEKEIEIEGLKEDIDHTRSQDKCLKDRINEMEAKEADLQMELDQIKTRFVCTYIICTYIFYMQTEINILLCTILGTRVKCKLSRKLLKMTSKLSKWKMKSAGVI